jgi:hypothetical protein
VTIAIPILHERVSPVLDTATRLLVVTRRRGKETARKEWVLHPMPPEALARSVAELNVDQLLCAAVSEELARALERHHIRLRPHLCGPVEAILKASGCGQLDRAEFRMPGCWGRHGQARRDGEQRPAQSLAAPQPSTTRSASMRRIPA